MDSHSHLPADKERAADARVAPRTHHPVAGVLVVDDEPGVRNLLRETLRHHGYAAWLAADGDEALALYRKHRAEIGLVLLDVRMPGLDGPQTLQELKALNPAVRCCFMTGHTGRYSEEELLELGALRVLWKPFRLHDVLAAVREFAEQSDNRPA